MRMSISQSHHLTCASSSKSISSNLNIHHFSCHIFLYHYFLFFFFAMCSAFFGSIFGIVGLRHFFFEHDFHISDNFFVFSFLFWLSWSNFHLHCHNSVTGTLFFCTLCHYKDFYHREVAYKAPHFEKMHKFIAAGEGPCYVKCGWFQHIQWRFWLQCYDIQQSPCYEELGTVITTILCKHNTIGTNICQASFEDQRSSNSYYNEWDGRDKVICSKKIC